MSDETCGYSAPSNYSRHLDRVMREGMRRDREKVQMLRAAVSRYIRATEEDAEPAVRGGLFAAMKVALIQSK